MGSNNFWRIILLFMRLIELFYITDVIGTKVKKAEQNGFKSFLKDYFSCPLSVAPSSPFVVILQVKSNIFDPPSSPFEETLFMNGLLVLYELTFCTRFFCNEIYVEIYITPSQFILTLCESQFKMKSGRH